MDDAEELPVPDPRSVTTAAELAAQLRILRVHAGQPSLREISKRARPSLSASAADDVLKGTRGLPRPEALMAVVCALGADDPREWATTWKRLKLQEKGLLSERRHTSSGRLSAAGRRVDASPTERLQVELVRAPLTEDAIQELLNDLQRVRQENEVSAGVTKLFKGLDSLTFGYGEGARRREQLWEALAGADLKAVSIQHQLALYLVNAAISMDWDELSRAAHVSPEIVEQFLHAELLPDDATVAAIADACGADPALAKRLAGWARREAAEDATEITAALAGGTT